jgi:hypothetical protein
MTPEHHARLSSCADLERLEQMLDAALTASSTDDVVR